MSTSANSGLELGARLPEALVNVFIHYSGRSLVGCWNIGSARELIVQA